MNHKDYFFFFEFHGYGHVVSIFVREAKFSLFPIYFAICSACFGREQNINTLDVEYRGVPVHQVGVILHPLLELERIQHIHESNDYGTVGVLFDHRVDPYADRCFSSQRGLQSNPSRR